jgi:hypothetical protein
MRALVGVTLGFSAENAAAAVIIVATSASHAGAKEGPFRAAPVDVTFARTRSIGIDKPMPRTVQ